MKRICIVYYLSDSPPLTQNECIGLKETYNVDSLIMLKACNQLDGLQYPYITVDEV